MYHDGMTATGTIAQIGALATSTALSTWGVAGDFLVVILLAAIFFLFAWYVGRGPFVALMLSFYGAYALYAVFPYQSLFPSEPAMMALLAHVGAYFALALAFYLILHRVIVSDFLYIGTFGLVILSLLGAAFLIALAYHVFPVADVYRFAPAIDALFAPAKYFFWWFAAPVVGLIFFAR